MEDIQEMFKKRYLGNITAAQKAGDIRPDINPEFLWLVLEKLAEPVKDGTWQSVFTKFSRYQKQLRTLLFYGLLARREEKK